MLLNWARNRISGPRFLPSGRRFGPCFCSRVAASVASSPFSRLVASCLTTASADIACHAEALLAVDALIATRMLCPPLGQFLLKARSEGLPIAPDDFQREQRHATGEGGDPGGKESK